MDKKNTSQKDLISNLLNTVVEGVIGLDTKGYCIFINPAALNYLGFREKEVLGKNIHDLIHYKYLDGKSYPKSKCFLYQTLKNPQIVRLKEEVFWHKNGKPLYVLYSCAAYFRNNQISGGVVTFIDNSQQKKVKEELLKLAAIVEQSDDAIFSKTLDGTITSWNKGAEKLYGYNKEEILGKNVRIIVPEDKKDELEGIFVELKKGRKIEQFETVRVRKDGRKVDVSISISPLIEDSGLITGFSTIARDITQSKELERRKDEFISIASHELKTPVTSLKGFLQILQNTLKDQEKPAYYLSKMKDQIDRLTMLINDLLDVSKIQSGKLELKKEKFVINDLINEVKDDLEYIFDDHKIIFRAKKRIIVNADRYRLNQVLINLLSNAIKYSPKAEEVKILVRSNKDKLVVQVKDQGIGISKKDLTKIFEPFYQADNTIRQSFAGLGLGLHITKEIIDRHNGEIWVESEKGKGSTFSFSIPKKI
jgi:PAS domain S-box-containing protein